jgi:hypothetical protein
MSQAFTTPSTNTAIMTASAPAEDECNGGDDQGKR